MNSLLPHKGFFEHMIRKLVTIQNNLVKLKFRIAEIVEKYDREQVSPLEISLKELYKESEETRIRVQDLINNFNPHAINDSVIKHITISIKYHQEKLQTLATEVYSFKL